MTYYVYQDSRLEWRWRLVAANNEIIAVSSEGYLNKDACLRSIGMVKSSSAAPVYQV